MQISVNHFSLASRGPIDGLNWQLDLACVNHHSDGLHLLAGPQQVSYFFSRRIFILQCMCHFLRLLLCWLVSALSPEGGS